MIKWISWRNVTMLLLLLLIISQKQIFLIFLLIIICIFCIMVMWRCRGNVLNCLVWVECLVLSEHPEIWLTFWWLWHFLQFSTGREWLLPWVFVAMEAANGAEDSSGNTCLRISSYLMDTYLSMHRWETERLLNECSSFSKPF